MDRTRCPPPEVLTELAVDGALRSANAGHARHLEECPLCQNDLGRLSGAVRALRELPSPGPADTSDECLTDTEIAALVEGSSLGMDAESVSHLDACLVCRGRVQVVADLVRDETVAAELRRLHGQETKALRPAVLRAATAVAALGAAFLAGVVLWPDNPAITGASGPDAGSIHRESAITTTSAPALVIPSNEDSGPDSLRWTSVPHADRYQVLVFDREGTLVWDPQTTDTALALPLDLHRETSTTFVWKVEARTDWDRWVASDWGEFTINGNRSQ